MIRKDAEVDEPSVQIRQRASKALGVADATKSQHGFPCEFTERKRVSLAINQVKRRMPRFDPFKCPRMPLGLSPNRCTISIGNQTGPRNDNDVGAPERSNRLAKQASRTQMR